MTELVFFLKIHTKYLYSNKKIDAPWQRHAYSVQVSFAVQSSRAATINRARCYTLSTKPLNQIHLGPILCTSFLWISYLTLLSSMWAPSGPSPSYDIMLSSCSMPIRAVSWALRGGAGRTSTSLSESLPLSDRCIAWQTRQRKTLSAPNSSFTRLHRILFP